MQFALCYNGKATDPSENAGPWDDVLCCR